jgi:hypothetical protein
MSGYLRRDFFRIDGYISYFDAQLFEFLLATQSDAGIQGSMAEIGVHHGRSFFMLAKARLAHEKALAIDVFEDDALYHDPRGLGRGVRFKQNCERLNVTLSPDEIFAGLSTTIGAAEIRRRVGPVRFFSIDGGHRYGDVLHDMQLAADSLAPRGIIVADDFMNPQWPEVSLATVDWLKTPGNTFTPLLSTPAKLYICHRNDKSFYQTQLRRFFAGGPYLVRETAIFADGYYFARQNTRAKLQSLLKERIVSRLFGTDSSRVGTETSTVAVTAA